MGDVLSSDGAGAGDSEVPARPELNEILDEIEDCERELKRHHGSIAFWLKLGASCWVGAVGIVLIAAAIQLVLLGVFGFCVGLVALYSTFKWIEERSDPKIRAAEDGLRKAQRAHRDWLLKQV